MQKFNILIRSFCQVQEFVNLAMAKPYEILVGNERQHINGKDLMGMFSLDYSRPVQVAVQCTEEEFQQFRQETAQFLT